jgi:hypothetical protein
MQNTRHRKGKKWQIHTHTHTHTQKPIYKHEDEKCCGIKGYIQKKGTVNRPDIIQGGSNMTGTDFFL